MTSAEEHYKNLLAEHYSWMVGNPEQQIAYNRAFFKKLNIHPDRSDKAIDLGCGTGIQSIALAQLGFEVTAVDSSQELLDELNNNPESSRINTKQGKMLDSSIYGNFNQYQVAVCMGDSLLHLESEKEIEQLFKNVSNMLVDEGSFILSFRDLSQELEGTDRMIPVRLEDEKLMSTFLEYTPTHVIVHDSIFLKEDGKWIMKKSSYPKLRISANTIMKMASKAVFMIEALDEINGIHYLVVCKQCSRPG